jgi:hypothetical protein
MRGSITPIPKNTKAEIKKETYPHPHPIILSPIRGGGDYRGIQNRPKTGTPLKKA